VCVSTIHERIPFIDVETRRDVERGGSEPVIKERKRRGGVLVGEERVGGKGPGPSAPFGLGAGAR